MPHKKLTAAEEKRLADAFAAQAVAMVFSNKKLPREIKQQVRQRVLQTIQAEHHRRQEYETAENTYT